MAILTLVALTLFLIGVGLAATALIGLFWRTGPDPTHRSRPAERAAAVTTPRVTQPEPDRAWPPGLNDPLVYFALFLDIAEELGDVDAAMDAIARQTTAETEEP